MTALFDRLAELTPELAAGLTVVLGPGFVAAIRQRSPIHSQRLGEATLVAALAFAAPA